MTGAIAFRSVGLAESGHAAPLDGASVHLWYVRSDRLDADTMTRLHGTLSTDERKRADDYFQARDRRTSIVARGLLREQLSRYCGIPAGELRFTTVGNGKPALAPGLSNQSVQFNISHSGGAVLLGFTRLAEVGVDIEAGNRHLDDLMGVAESFFAPGETAALKRLSADQQRRGFLNCWTRKEAFIKVHGEGLSRDLNSFEVELAPNAAPRLLRLDGSTAAAERYSLYAVDPDPDHVAAICLPARPAKLEAFAWNGTFQ